jgi:hypothetical protein
VPETIDELLAEIRALSAEIDSLDPDDPKHRKLDARREELRAAARHAADATRHPKAVATQIEALEARLVEIESLLIKQGFTERRVGKAIQDPSAYSHNINKAIAADHADEVRSINEQLARLRAVAEPNDGESGG